MTVTEKTDSVSPWITAARNIAPEVHAALPDETGTQGHEDDRWGFLAAHGGAGATAWASLLDGTDCGHQLPPVGSTVILVARASMHGIEAAKTAIAAHGRAAFAAVLIVPAAPGRTQRAIVNELKVLAGAVPVVQVPWVSGLLIKRSALADFTDIGAKDLDRIRTALSSITTKGDRK